MNCNKDYKKVERPWGSYVVLEQQKSFWLKKIFVKKGEELSLQSHAGRIEIWVVLSGQILARKGENELTLREGGQIRIEKEEKHRIKGLTDACVLEIAFGELSEEDIVRYEDKYGRVSKKIPSRN